MSRRDTRAAIVDAAVAILGRDGAEGLSASALAREVGISKATLFHHFSSIDEIPLVAFERMVARGLEVDIPARAGLGEIMAALGAGNFALVDARRDFLRAYFVFVARAMFDPALAALVRRSGDALLARMRTLLRPHVGTDAEAAALARLAALTLDGLAVHLMAFDDRAEIEAAWRLFATLVGDQRRQA